MRKRHSKSLLTGSFLALFLMTGQVQAALFDFSITGEIDYDDFGFGPLPIGSEIRVEGQYEEDSIIDNTVAGFESLLDGLQFIDFADTSNSMNMNILGTPYSSDEDDISAMFFFEGLFDGISFLSADEVVEFDGFNFMDSIIINGVDEFDPPISLGTWRDDFLAIEHRDGPDPSVIPVPAAVWLFGTALLGMAGFSKRRKVKV